MKRDNDAGDNPLSVRCLVKLSLPCFFTKPIDDSLAGQGLFKWSDEKGLYSGNWVRDKRQGVGEEVTVSGRYQVRRTIRGTMRLSRKFSVRVCVSSPLG